MQQPEVAPKVDESLPLACPVTERLDVGEFGDEVCDRKTIAELVLWAQGYENCTGLRAELTYQRLVAATDVKTNRKAREELTRLLKEPETSRVWDKILGELPKDVSKSKAVRAMKDFFRVRLKRSPEEAFLLDVYTGSAYVRINRVLRAGGRRVECLKPLVSEIVQLYRSFPAYRGTIWRGLSLEPKVLEQYSDGAIVEWPAFSSSSVSRKVAEDYSWGGSGGSRGVVFKIESKSCRDIRAINGFQEDEILCMPGMKVRVKAHEGPNVIILEEINSPPTK